MVEGRDGRESDLRACERVHEVEVGLLVGGDEPSVRRADEGAAPERRVREPHAEAVPARGAVQGGRASSPE